MSNNSWKQYGGIAKMEEYNVINANTIVAEQFVSRSTRPIYQFLNGTFEVSNDLSAANNIITSNSFYCFVDTTVNNNLYANQKLFFGSGTFQPISSNLSTDSSHAFMYGNSNFIGVNIQNPNAIFHVTSNVPEETNILVVESSNNYIRNILAQNKNDRGVVLDADDTSANLYFHLDSSTNRFNVSDANITYTLGGNLSTSVSNDFIVHSKFNNIRALENIHFDSSGGYILDTSGTSTLIDRSNANMTTDISGIYKFHSFGDYLLSTSDDMNFTVLNGNINIDTNKTNYHSFVNISHTTRGISGETYDQLLTVYDVSNVQFLPNAYDISGILTGNSIVGVAKDSSSNTFIRLISANTQLGSAYGGGVFPNDTSRSVSLMGVNDTCGNYLHNQMIISNNNKDKYLTTMGINTFSPKSDQYIVDLNGPIRIANGEIQTMAEINFELKSVHYSKTHPNYGIAVGTPSTLTDDATNPIYNQFSWYTNDGGINWQLSNNIYGTSDFNQTRVNFLDTFVYDSNYAFIVGEKSYIYYTNDSGKNWYRSTYGDLLFRDQTNIIGTQYGSNIRFFIPYRYNNVATSQVDTYTKQIRYFDLPVANLGTALNGNIYSIGSSEVALDIDVTCSTSSSTKVFFAGQGIAIYLISLTETPVYTLQTYTYHDILAVNDDLIVAVGNNVISYSNDAGLNWTTIDLLVDTSLVSNLNNVNNVVLKSIHARDENIMTFVGDQGVFGFTKNGPAKENWQIVPNTVLNSSGIAERINGTNNSLLDIHMTSDDAMIISNVITNSFNDENNNDNDILGFSKILHVFIPSLFNDLNNTIMDICGNMNISGYLKMQAGDLTINNRLFVGQDVSFNKRLYVQERTILDEDVSMNMRLFVQKDVSLNSRFYVQDKSIFENDVSMVGRLFVNEDVSFNKRLYVQERTILDEDVSMNMRLFVQKDVSLNSRFYVQDKSIFENDVSMVGRLFVNEDVSFNKRLYVQERTILDEDVSMNMRLFVQKDVSLNSRFYVQDKSIFENDVSMVGRLFVNEDVSFNKRLYVSKNSIFDLDVSMNTRLFVNQDVSFNRRLFVKDNITLPSTSRLYVNYIDGNPDGTFPNSKNLSIGENTQIINIGDVAPSSRISDNYYTNPDSSYNYINIGAVQPNVDVKPYYIQIGNYLTTIPDVSQNKIVIGGASDDIVFGGGGITIQSEAEFLVTNKVVRVNNDAPDPNESQQAGLYIYENFGAGNVDANAGFIVISDDRRGFNLKSTVENSHIVTLETEDMSLNFNNPYNTEYGINDIQNGLLVLTQSSESTGGDYSITVKPIDISNILIRDSNASNQETQYILTKVAVNDDLSLNNRFFVSHDVSLNKRLYVKESTIMDEDVSMNMRLFVHKDVSLNSRFYVQDKSIFENDVSMVGRLFVNEDVSLNKRLYVQERTILDEDVSMNMRLFVQKDVSLNSRFYVQDKSMFGNDVSMIGRLFVNEDVSLNKRLYVKENSIFEGDVSVNQNVFIGKDLIIDGNLFVEQYSNETIINTTTTQYFLTIAEDMSLNGRIFVRDDASFNSRLYVQDKSIFENDVSMVGRLFVNEDVSLNKRLYVQERTILDEDVSMNMRLFVQKDVSLNSRFYVQDKSIFENDVSMVGRLFVNQDVSLNSRFYVQDKSIFENDVSMVGRLFVNQDVSFNKRLYVQERTILDEDVSMNMRLFVQKDVSLNNRLYVKENSIFGNDVSMNNKLYVQDKIGINNYSPIISLDINSHDAIRIPVGTTTERGLFAHETGQIRFNTTTSQFEGYNDSGAWQGLGGVIDVDQNTFILAESAPTKDENQLRFFTADHNNDASLMKPRLQMLLDASNGGLAIGHSISADVSNNLYNPPSDGLTVLGDVSMNNSAYIANRLGISTHGAVVSLDISTNDALKLPTGIDTERPVLSTDYFEGFVRFNNNYFHDPNGDYTYEGSYGTNEWKPLGQHWKGVIDTDGDTYITAETSYNFDNDDLKFYTSGDLRMTINQNGNMGFGTVPNDSSFNFNGTANFTEDVSLNKNLFVGQDVSLNGDLHVGQVAYTTRLEHPLSTASDRKTIDLGNSLIDYNNITGVPESDRNIESVPQGGIILWLRPNNIPTGFAICDGQDTVDILGATVNIPDLRSKFVIGYHDSDPSFGQVGNTGGSFNITSEQLPEHSHYSVENHSYGGTDYYLGQYNSVSTHASGGNYIGVSIDDNDETKRYTTSSTLTGGSGQNYAPPYYVAVYIIRVSTALSTDQQLLGQSSFYVPNRLGIGITNPAAHLHIDYEVEVGSNDWYTDASMAQLLISDGGVFNDDSGRFAIGFVDNYAFLQAAYHSSTTDISKNISMQPKGGNVGIGTTSPLGTLDVGGAIRGDLETNNIGIIVAAGPSSDSVSHDFTSSTAILRITGNSATNNLQFGLGDSGYNYSPWIQASYDNSSTISQVSGSKSILLNPLGGNVGIGTTSPGEILDVNGTVQATSFNATSDARLKDNIVPLNNPLLKIVQLQGVNFTWKKEDTNIINAGLIAQDIEKVIPEVVTTQNNEMQQKSVNYNGLIPYLIESVKTLSNDKEIMQQEIDNLKNENKAMKEKMKQYDEWFAQLMNK